MQIHQLKHTQPQIHSDTHTPLSLSVSHYLPQIHFRSLNITVTLFNTCARIHSLAPSSLPTAGKALNDLFLFNVTTTSLDLIDVASAVPSERYAFGFAGAQGKAYLLGGKAFIKADTVSWVEKMGGFSNLNENARVLSIANDDLWEFDLQLRGWSRLSESMAFDLQCEDHPFEYYDASSLETASMAHYNWYFFCENYPGMSEFALIYQPSGRLRFVGGHSSGNSGVHVWGEFNLQTLSWSLGAEKDSFITIAGGDDCISPEDWDAYVDTYGSGSGFPVFEELDTDGDLCISEADFGCECSSEGSEEDSQEHCDQCRSMYSSIAGGDDCISPEDWDAYIDGQGDGGGDGGGDGSDSADFSACSDDQFICCSGPCCSDIGSDEISDGPGHYGDSETCKWRFVSPSDAFSLSFLDFNTESGFDYVRIYHCDDVAAESCAEVASLDGDLTGSTDTYNSPASGIMKLVFASDSSETREGFVAQCKH